MRKLHFHWSIPFFIAALPLTGAAQEAPLKKMRDPNAGTIVIDASDIAAGRTPDMPIATGKAPGTVSIRSKAELQQERMDAAANRLRGEMECTDGEWNVLQPRIARIEALRDVVGEPSAPISRAESITAGDITARVRNAIAELNRGIETGAREGALKQLMTSVRDLRQEARDELAKARQDLQSLLNTKQEAVLLQRGTLR